MKDSMADAAPIAVNGSMAMLVAMMTRVVGLLSFERAEERRTRRSGQAINSPLSSMSAISHLILSLTNGSELSCI